MAYVIEKGCVGCQYCKNVCPAGAIRIHGAGYWIDADKCVGCGSCAQVCHLNLIHPADAVPPAPEKHEKRALTCDVVVIGAGGVGTGAAARCADLGLDVILLEASKRFGGGTYLAHGATFPGSKTVYGRLGIDDDVEGMVGFWTMISGNTIRDEDALRANIRANGAFLDWFDSLDPSYGAVFARAPEGAPFAFEMRGRYLNEQSDDDSIGPGWMGSWITEKLFDAAIKRGVRYFPETRAMHFRTGPDGAVTGVLAVDPGGETEIAARAFVLATGSYLYNDDYLRAIDSDYVREGAEILRLTVPTNVGDGHRMAAELGAETDVSYARTRGPCHHPYSFAVNRLMSDPVAVYFSDEGRRLFDRSGERPGLPGERIVEGPDTPGQKILHSRTGTCYCIMDSVQLQQAGERLERSAIPGQSDYLSAWRESVETECALEDRPARKADTLEALAEKLGMDAAVLTESVARYNALCAKGVDEDFGKPAQDMVPIAVAPFYAFLGQNFDNGASMGGVTIDNEFRVLRPDATAIAGVYCAGDCASYSPAGQKGPVGLVGGLGGSWASGYQIANYIADFLRESGGAD